MSRSCKGAERDGQPIDSYADLFLARDATAPRPGVGRDIDAVLIGMQQLRCTDWRGRSASAPGRILCVSGAALSLNVGKNAPSLLGLLWTTVSVTRFAVGLASPSIAFLSPASGAYVKVVLLAIANQCHRIGSGSGGRFHYAGLPQRSPRCLGRLQVREPRIVVALHLGDARPAVPRSRRHWGGCYQTWAFLR